MIKTSIKQTLNPVAGEGVVIAKRCNHKEFGDMFGENENRTGVLREHAKCRMLNPDTGFSAAYSHLMRCELKNPKSQTLLTGRITVS